MEMLIFGPFKVETRPIGQGKFTLKTSNLYIGQLIMTSRKLLRNSQSKEWVFQNPIQMDLLQLI